MSKNRTEPLDNGPHELEALRNENRQLRDQLKNLDDQVKRIFKAEQRLFSYQKELDRQLTRIHAVNQFALQAATVFEPRQILNTAMDTLMSVFALDQGVGFLRDDERFLAVAVSAARGMEFDSASQLERSHGESPIELSELPLEPQLGRAADVVREEPSLRTIVEILDRLYRNEDEDEHPPPSESLVAVLPLRGQRDSALMGAIAIRKRFPQVVSPHEVLPQITDLPFLQLLTGHLESTLESALLHERVADFAAEMEARVAERTEALLGLNHELEASLKELRQTQGQLFQAGKMAAIGTLVAGLSHELNTPLGVVLGYAQTLLQHADEDNPMHGALIAMERQAKRAHQLVQSLLDFSRNRPPTREQVEPEAIIQQVHELARAQAQQANAILNLGSISSPLPALFANSNELESALLNLIGNALDAVGTEGAVELSAHPAEFEGRPGVEFVIADSGGGIPDEVQPWVFDPFFTTKPVGKGTGLGLALTRRIVRAHGGHIEFESEPGQGTTMHVWIPTIDGLLGEPDEVIG